MSSVTYTGTCLLPSCTANVWPTPFHVAEKFTGVPGVYVPLKETLRGFKAILSGEMDQYPESAFYNVGTIDDVVKKAEQLKSGA